MLMFSFWQLLASQSLWLLLQGLILHLCRKKTGAIATRILNILKEASKVCRLPQAKQQKHPRGWRNWALAKLINTSRVSWATVYYRQTFPTATVIPKMHLMEDHMVIWTSKWRVGFGTMGEQAIPSNFSSTEQGFACTVHNCVHGQTPCCGERAPSQDIPMWQA
jgi:hypothetical protein